MPQSCRRMQLTPAPKVRRAQHRPAAGVATCPIRLQPIHRTTPRRMTEPFAWASTNSMPAASSSLTKPGKRSGCARPNRKRLSCRASSRLPPLFTTSHAAILAARCPSCRPAWRVWIAFRRCIAASPFPACAPKPTNGPPSWRPAGGSIRRRPGRKLNSLPGSEPARPDQ
jgi:hypothetical protein